MIAFLFRCWFFLYLSFCLTACGLSQNQLDPSPFTSPNSTAEPEQTVTAMPTNTPQPSSTPIPSATITPTSTPQPGATRVNSQTGQEEILTDQGQWITFVHEWKIEEKGSLPTKVNKENAWFEEHEDGSVALRFTLDDPNRPDHGKEFEYIIPSIGRSELLNYDGDMVPVRFRGILYDGTERRPGIRMVDESNNRLAYFDINTENWISIFSNTLTDFDHQKLSPYMPQELGLHSSYVTDDSIEGYAGLQKIRRFQLVCEPVRLFEWRMVNSNNEYTKTVTIMELVCNEERVGNIYIPIWDTSAKTWDAVRVFEYNAANQSWDELPLSEKNEAEMLSLPPISPRISPYFVIFSEAMTKNMTNIKNFDLTVPFNGTYSGGDAWYRSLMIVNETYDRQVKWADEVLATGKSELEGVLIGPSELNFLTETPAD